MGATERTPVRRDWVDGWWRHARHCASPNHGPRPHGVAVELAILHSISLPPGRYGGSEVEQFFLNRLDHDAHPFFNEIRGLQVSAHFFIRRDGEVVQFVSCDRRAWHAGTSQWQGRDNCNDWSVGIELEGLEGGLFEPPQYESLLRLLRALRRCHPLGQVVGHEHVAPVRKRDPGPGFDWLLLRRRLRWPSAMFPKTSRARTTVDLPGQIGR